MIEFYNVKGISTHTFASVTESQISTSFVPQLEVLEAIISFSFPIGNNVKF